MSTPAPARHACASPRLAPRVDGGYGEAINPMAVATIQ
jgi:hypothetical protein